MPRWPCWSWTAIARTRSRLWDRHRALRSSRRDVPMLLVAGRTDANPVRLSSAQLDELRDAGGFARYLATSAKNDVGCRELREAILATIDWSRIPWRSSPQIFRRLKRAILDLKDTGRALTSAKELRDWLPAQIGAFTPEELDAVIGLLAGPGAVLPLEFGDYVLLQPELVNAYAQAVIATMRDDPLERGCIAEERVLRGDLSFPPDFKRLDEADERAVLHAMHRQLVDRALCLREHDPRGREPAMLVFPSFYRRERPDAPGRPQAFASYRFDGWLDEVYATLVVRLHHTRPFESHELWRNAADLKTAGGKAIGLRLLRRDDGMESEFKTDDGKATGRKLYLQFKSGDSHLRARQRDGSRAFQIAKPRHADYWADQAFPMLLVIRDSEGAIEWMEIGEHLRARREAGNWPLRTIAFDGERFDVMSIRRWRDRVLGTA